MGLEKILQDFCREHGYTYQTGWNGDQYKIVISKGKDNAGAFLPEEEYKELDEERLKEILILLDRGFKEIFNK